MSRNTKHDMINITRYTYKIHSFQGYRVSISRQRVPLVLYFSDKTYGSQEVALATAQECRKNVLDEVKDLATSAEVSAVFARFKKQYTTRVSTPQRKKKGK